MEFALFLLKIKKITKKKIYMDKLTKIITKIAPVLNSNVCKFKIRYGASISQCALSFIRSSQLDDDKLDLENSDMDITDDKNSEED